MEVNDLNDVSSGLSHLSMNSPPLDKFTANVKIMEDDQKTPGVVAGASQQHRKRHKKKKKGSQRSTEGGADQSSVEHPSGSNKRFRSQDTNDTINFLTSTSSPDLKYFKKDGGNVNDKDIKPSNKNSPEKRMALLNQLPTVESGENINFTDQNGEKLNEAVCTSSPSIVDEPSHLLDLSSQKNQISKESTRESTLNTPTSSRKISNEKKQNAASPKQRNADLHDYLEEPASQRNNEHTEKSIPTTPTKFQKRSISNNGPTAESTPKIQESKASTSPQKMFKYDKKKQNFASGNQKHETDDLQNDLEHLGTQSTKLPTTPVKMTTETTGNEGHIQTFRYKDRDPMKNNVQVKTEAKKTPTKHNVNLRHEETKYSENFQSDSLVKMPGDKQIEQFLTVGIPESSKNLQKPISGDEEKPSMKLQTANEGGARPKETNRQSLSLNDGKASEASNVGRNTVEVGRGRGRGRGRHQEAQGANLFTKQYNQSKQHVYEANKDAQDGKQKRPYIRQGTSREGNRGGQRLISDYVAGNKQFDNARGRGGSRLQGASQNNWRGQKSENTEGRPQTNQNKGQEYSGNKGGHVGHRDGYHDQQWKSQDQSHRQRRNYKSGNSFEEKRGGSRERPRAHEPQRERTTTQRERQLPDFIKIVNGDLFSCDDNVSLAHCVSSDLAMGKGIAVEFKRRFKGVGELTEQGKITGEVAVLERGQRYVYYLITKPRFFMKPTYESMTACLMSLKTLILEHHVTELAIPQIGCGLDNLDWDNVLDSIIKIFEDANVNIVAYIYKPPKR